MNWLKLIENIVAINKGGNNDPLICDIVFDSRQVKQGAVFVAVQGYAVDGNRFIDNAIKKGASAIISENPQERCSIPWVQVSDCRKILAVLSKKLWNINFDEFIAIGITGTNGKTTTASLYHNLFKCLYGKSKAWMFGTIVYEMGDDSIEASRTTPEASDLFRLIGKAQNKPDVVTMEVSSHAIDLRRVEGYLFDLAIWTNLTQDHLDFHGTMESYYESKKKMFTENIKDNGIAIINIDDSWGRKLSTQLSDITMITYGVDSNADMRIIKSKVTWDGIELDIIFRNKKMHFESSFVGAFNVYNLAAMLSGALGRGISMQEIQNSLDCMQTVSGRMDRVDVSGEFTIVVDYAHTPDALENVCKTARELTTGKLLCVFGCGGDRDHSKRSLMAEAVARNCDEAIITSDNPRTEKPKKIIEEILDGIPLDFTHFVIPDRRKAIQKSLTLAHKGDCVIIAGKGHENYQEIDGVRHHFDDREIVIESFREMELNSSDA